MQIGFIVEGLHDREKVLEVFPHSIVVVTESRINNRVKLAVHEMLVQVDIAFILTDPDETGDIHASKLNDTFNLPRIRPDEKQCAVTRGTKTNYGVEYMKNSDLYNLIYNVIRGL